MTPLQCLLITGTCLPSPSPALPAGPPRAPTLLHGQKKTAPRRPKARGKTIAAAAAASLPPDSMSGQGAPAAPLAPVAPHPLRYPGGPHAPPDLMSHEVRSSECCPVCHSAPAAALAASNLPYCLPCFCPVCSHCHPVCHLLRAALQTIGSTPELSTLHCCKHILIFIPHKY